MIEESLEYFKNRLSKTLSDKRREAYQDAAEALKYLEYLKKHDAIWHLVKDELPPEREEVLIRIRPRTELEAQTEASIRRSGTRIVMGYMQMEHGFPEFYEGNDNIYRFGFIPEMWMPIRFLYFEVK